jgi:acyl-coenzyme A synthetase/AMP-(fatty) acid ligase
VIDAKYLPIRSDDVFLQLAPVAFDASTLEVWGALLNGAALVLAPSSELTMTELTSFIRDHKVTVLFLTTGLFHQLTRADFGRMSCLRYLLTGGEVLSVPQANQAVAGLPESVVIHAYGPTENTTFTTCYPITARVTSAFVPLGPPIDGSLIYLLDEHLDPVPPGEIGELFAAGIGLAHGYVNNSALTAESFLPDPFGAHPGAYMYRTGDLACQRKDGSLEFLGRIDSQIKVRGFRVEPTEIEVALQAHPDIVASCVVLQDFPGTEKRLTSFYVSDDAIPTAELRRMLSEKLPQYMIPARFSRLDALPLKPNGKVDRTLLMQMRQNGRPDVGSDFREPSTLVEKWLAELWRDLLEISEVGVNDDFFELGGHSLLAIRITGEISTEFNVLITSQAFYENPTVLELASVLKGLGVISPTHTSPRES